MGPRSYLLASTSRASPRVRSVAVLTGPLKRTPTRLGRTHERFPHPVGTHCRTPRPPTPTGRSPDRDRGHRSGNGRGGGGTDRGGPLTPDGVTMDQSER